MSDGISRENTVFVKSVRQARVGAQQAITLPSSAPLDTFSTRKSSCDVDNDGTLVLPGWVIREEILLLQNNAYNTIPKLREEGSRLTWFGD